MKKNTSRHPKMLAFARSLDISRVWARGVMGELWEWAGDFALFGDIGKHTNQAIADAVDWTDNADRLIGAMIDAGWIDEVDDERRLVLHDWEDGCDQWISKRLLRARKGDTADNGGQRPPTADGGSLVKKGKGREGKGKKRKEKKPDLWWDAICVEWGFNPQTDKERRRIGALARDFKLKGEPGAIGLRRAVYVAKHPTWTDTPDAVLKHWDQLGTNSVPRTVQQGGPAPSEIAHKADVLARAALLTDEEITERCAALGGSYPAAWASGNMRRDSFGDMEDVVKDTKEIEQC